MTTYYAYQRDTTGATWTEMEEMVSFRGPDRIVNEPSTLIVIMRDEGGATLEAFPATTFGKHVLLTNGTFSGTTGANTLWHGRIRDIRTGGISGQVSLLCEDWLGQLYDTKDRYTSRRVLRSRATAGYGEINDDDEMRYISAYSGTTITDATITDATNDVFNTSCAVVFTENRNAQRVRKLADYKVGQITFYPSSHIGGSPAYVGLTDAWNHTNRYGNSLVVGPWFSLVPVGYAGRVEIHYHIPYHSTNSTGHLLKMHIGAYCTIDSTNTTSRIEIYNDDTPGWEDMSTAGWNWTTSGGTAWDGEWTSSGYKSAYHTMASFPSQRKWISDDGLIRIRIIQNAYSTSKPEICLHYGKMSVWNSIALGVRQLQTFPITDTRVTGATAVIASSISFADAGIATNDVYMIAKRTDLYIQDLITDNDYQVALSTAGVAQNPVYDQFVAHEWFGVSPINVITDLSQYDKSDYWVDPTTDTFYYNQSPAYDPSTGTHLQASSDTFDILDAHYDFEKFFTRCEVYGHAWGRGETESGEEFQVRYTYVNDLAEDEYRLQREHAYVHPGVLNGAAAMTYAQNFINTHSVPVLRMKLRKPSYYDTVGIGDVVKVTNKKHGVQGWLMYCWHWLYDHQNDITTLELRGPVDTWTVSRPESMFTEIQEIKRLTTEVAQGGGTSGSESGGSWKFRPRGVLP